MLTSQLEDTTVLNFNPILIFSTPKTQRYLIWLSSYVDVLQQKQVKFIALLHKARAVPEIVVIPHFFVYLACFLKHQNRGNMEKRAFKIPSENKSCFLIACQTLKLVSDFSGLDSFTDSGFDLCLLNINSAFLHQHYFLGFSSQK